MVAMWVVAAALNAVATAVQAAGGHTVGAAFSALVTVFSAWRATLWMKINDEEDET